ncbi:MAG: ParA family protein [Treponema sp.]|nr:ParA family protein [Treponema sp.]
MVLTFLFTFTNGKGGTGKTTLNVLLSETLCKRGKKVLGIDLDFNSCFSAVYHFELKDETSKLFLSGKMVTPYHVKDNASGGLIDIIPSDLDMNMLSNVMDTQLKIMLKKSGFLEQYDYIILDPPGTWNAQNRNAVFAANKIVISTTFSSLDFNATIKYFDQLSNCMLDADVMVICNKSNSRQNLDGIQDMYRAQFGEYLINAQIPDIKSMKKLVDNPDYPLHPSVLKRLDKYVSAVIGRVEVENA